MTNNKSGKLQLMFSPSIAFHHHCLQMMVDAFYGITHIAIQYFHALGNNHVRRHIERLQEGEAPEEVLHRLHLRLCHLQCQRPHTPELRRQPNSAHGTKQCRAKLQLLDSDSQVAEHLQPRRTHYIYRGAPVDVVREQPL